MYKWTNWFKKKSFQVHLKHGNQIIWNIQYINAFSMLSFRRISRLPVTCFVFFSNSYASVDTHPLSLASMSRMISSRWLTRDTSSWRSSCSLCCWVDDFCQSAGKTAQRDVMVHITTYRARKRRLIGCDLTSSCSSGADKTTNWLPVKECNRHLLFKLF